MRGRLRRLGLVALLVAGPGVKAPAAPGTGVSVPPGGLVRWPGAGVTRCFREGHEVPAVAGECLFAVDLFRAPGPMTLSRVRDGKRESVTVKVEPSPYPVEEITLPTDRYVRLSPADQARAEKERREMARVFARRTPPRFSLPLSRPLAETPPGRNFGRKRVFNGEARQPHAGVDYPVPDGTGVLAADDGVVALSAQHFFPGRLVVIDHGGGLFSMYFHLSKAFVETGAVVRRGEKIAASGATGRVNGAHLHFGIHWQEARVNPELLFRPPAELPAVGP